MKTQILPPPIARLLLAVLMCLPICGSHAFAQKSYAVLDKTTNTLTFKHDTKKPVGAFALNEGGNAPGWYKPNDYGGNANIIKKVVFDASFANARPTSCYKWFYGCPDLTTIEGIEYLKTENVTNMSYMFADCFKLTTLDVSKFDTKNVTDMSYMFSGCYKLTTLDVSKFDTKNVTDMRWMFNDCYKLTTLDVSNFDTKNVTNMSEMFSYCETLTTLDLSSFNTQNVTSMSYMFSHCSALTTLDFSSFETKNVTNMSYMFRDCSALTTLDLSSFSTKHVTNMCEMFYGCSALKTLDLSSFNTRHVTNMEWMFYGCSALTTIYTRGKFVVTTVCVKATEMFRDCTNLVGAVPYEKGKTGQSMANYTTGYFTYKAPTETYAMFDESTNTLTFKHDTNAPYGAFALNDGENEPEWYEPTVYNENEYHIKKVVFDASFANARPTSCYEWFLGCKDLTTIEGIEYLNTQNVTSMRLMFSRCSALTTLDVSKFDTQNVTDMSGIFNGCSALTTLNVSNFDTKNVTDMIQMFNECSALTTLDLSNFDTQNVTNMHYMFSDCSALTTIYASDKFVTTACGKDENMFEGCKNLVGAVPYDASKVGKKMANYTTGYFTYKAPTGIDAPTVSDDTAAEYYDLQGRRLNAPQKGVNIVKRGKKTTKMLVK